MQMRALAIALALVACDGDPPSVVVEIQSDLEIPRETNSLLARVQFDGRTIAEETYALGDPPRDRWPQTLPLIAGDTYDDRVMLFAEARIAISGPSAIAGFGQIEVVFPESGSDTLVLELPRACRDDDHDGYGIGFGCKKPDCDDTNDRIPYPSLCPGFIVPDAGMGDSGESDSGADAGPSDGGNPPDPDGGTNGFPCGMTTCNADQTCLGDMCWKSCMTTEDCGVLALACLEDFGVCICRVPCFSGSSAECPLETECISGCCNI